MKHIPYGRQSIGKDDIEAAVKVLRSDWITQGPKIREFEEALCGYAGSKYAVAVSSGTAALHVACLAAGIKEGDEVITSPITFAASANCALFCGGRPVFADIREGSVNIDPCEIRKKTGKRTKVIIPVHFAGHPADLEEIRKIAKERGLTVIEDAAHALGAEYKGSKIGSCKYSDMTVFSFHPLKSITTGEGGAVLTNSKALYERLLLYRNHGITKDRDKMEKSEGPWYYEMHELGFNYRITDFQSAIGISQLKKLDRFVEERRKIASLYSEELSGLDGIILPLEKPYVRSAWHIYYVRLRDAKKRGALFHDLQKSNIGLQVHYIPVHLQPYYRKLFGYKEGDYPIAERYYKSAMTLPLFPGLKQNQIKYVVRSLKKAFL